jgi:hypothetical protein
MNKTLIVLGTGIWGVMLLLRFVLSPDTSNLGAFTNPLLIIIEIVAFIIVVVGIIKRD